MPRSDLPRDWRTTDGFPGVETFKNVYALTTWDPDGNGPSKARLVAGGDFQYIADRVTDSVAAFVPESGRWEDLGGGVERLQGDEGGGPVFDTAYVDVLASFQQDLIVAGFFDEAGGVAVNNIARWDGEVWWPLGDGLDGSATAMTVFDGELVVAGSFPTAGGVTVNNIARWNGATWQPVGSSTGTNGAVHGLAVYDGALVAVGDFTTAGGVPANHVARWNGVQWQALGSGLDDAAFALAVLGSDLYVGGDFTLAGGVQDTRGVARWDGASWNAVAGGAFGGVSELAVYRGALVAGGAFIANVAGGPARHVARLDAATQTWQSMQGGFNAGGTPSALVVYGDRLYAGGIFSRAGDRTVRGIARWSGDTQTWERIAPGFDITPTHFASYHGDLVAGGGFRSAGEVEANGVARWDGHAWHALGGGITDGAFVGVIDDLEVFDDRLIVGGHYFGAGGVSVNHVAAWDGDTETWSDLGGGVSGGEIPRVHALAVFGGDLIAAGEFNSAGGRPAFDVARWDGSQWHAMGAGVGIAFSMAEFEGSLYVSVFSGSEGMQRWDGSEWHAVPGGFNNFSMTVWDGKLISGFLDPMAFDGNTWTMLPGWSWDPNGAGVGNFEYVVLDGDLIVAGQFENAAGIPEADGLVRFDGSRWHSLATAHGTLASITSGAHVHERELITNGRVVHPDGSVSNWRRLGWEWTDFRVGVAGSSGVPVLAASGTPEAGGTGTLTLTSARPSSPALLLVSLASARTSLAEAALGGALAAWPGTFAVRRTTDASGALQLPYTWPSGVPAGTPVTLQFAVKDPAAPRGVALSNALRGVAR